VNAIRRAKVLRRRRTQTQFVRPEAPRIAKKTRKGARNEHGIRFAKAGTHEGFVTGLIHAHRNTFPHGAPGETGTAWIDALCPDFSAHSFLRKSSDSCPILGRLAYAVDRAAASALSVPYRRKIYPHLSDTTLQEYIDYHAFYSQPRFLDDPGSAFPEPPERHAVIERTTRRRSWDPKTAKLASIDFESPFQTLDPRFREEYASLEPNERVESRAWFHEDRPRPVVIFLHGFSAPDYRINKMWFSAQRYYDAGLDVVFMNLPLHGGRLPSSAAFHGAAIIQPSVWRLSEACAQGVMDLRILIRYLLARGAPKVGIVGYSWGGFHASMLACLEPRTDFIVSIAPVVSIADLVMSWPTRTFFEESLDEPALMIRELRKILAPFTPLSHPLSIPKDRVLLAASANDGIIPAIHTEALWEHFGRPEVYWSCGGHILYFDKERVTDRALNFIRSLEVVP
jgi:pimeloyl-ACP methyl ester carboxylesterase